MGRLSQAVQTGYLNRGFEYWTTPDLGLQATGALFLTLRNPDGSPKVIPGTSLNARASCGLTFISPRYAITAAHCVSETDIPNPEIQSFAVQTYDTRNLQVDRIPTAVTGKFPNYSHGHLQPSDGYVVTQYNQCSVVKRCAKAYGIYHCDGGNADVALIKCADRPAGSPHVSVASSDALTGPVEMYWFHEVLDMPIAEPESSDDEALDHLNHYWYLFGRDSKGKESNYHYHPDNQLLPLHSVAWPDGTPPRRVYTSPQLGVIYTDLFACHGSSGSGVFQRTNGVLELLGPVVLTGYHWAQNLSPLLCVDLFQAQQGDELTAYAPVTNSQILQANARSDPGEGMSEWVAWFVAAVPI